jgi:hypothetical protein
MKENRPLVFGYPDFLCVTFAMQLMVSFWRVLIVQKDIFINVLLMPQALSAVHAARYKLLCEAYDAITVLGMGSNPSWSGAAQKSCADGADRHKCLQRNYVYTTQCPNGATEWFNDTP